MGGVRLSVTSVTSVASPGRGSGSELSYELVATSRTERGAQPIADGMCEPHRRRRHVTEVVMGKVRVVVHTPSSPVVVER